MLPSDPTTLRRLFVQIASVVAASGCGASVSLAPGDAATELGRATVDAASDDRPPPVDAPTASDVPATADLGTCAPVYAADPGMPFCSGEDVSFPCGLPPELLAVTRPEGTVEDRALCQAFCNPRNPRYPDLTCNLVRRDDGSRYLRCEALCGGGRRPEGFVLAPVTHARAVARWFASLAALEHASVAAFDRLADELALHGAPARLVADARASAIDERRHTALARKLARGFGVDPSLPLVAKANPRPLADVARDNAVEGCVREAYGALVATWQSTHARSPDVASAMEVIADDETRHAALSWSVHAWADARLEDRDRDEVRAAMAQALATLHAELDAEVDPELVSWAGLPDRAQQLALLAELATAIRPQA